MEKQYKAIAEGQANGNAILSYSIEVKPEGFAENIIAWPSSSTI